MNKCFTCHKETSNPKFCSRSCAATYNNKEFPKIMAVTRYRCEVCGNKVEKGRRYCSLSCRHLDRKIIEGANYQHVKKTRRRIKDRAVEYLGGKCKICGYHKCSRSLVFHHINPEEKDFAISTNTNKAWDKMKLELDKCILLCANCHGEVHDGLITI
jgi:5-methylcytosine-specific restriction endonuclease McrA